MPTERVGVGWIYSACGRCEICCGCENLCLQFQATGRDAPGGYAELMTVKVDFAVKIPVYLPDTQAAPLLCAGAIRYRSVRLSGIADGQNLDLSGFGSRGDKTAIERFLSGTRALALDSHIFRALAVDLRH